MASHFLASLLLLSLLTSASAAGIATYWGQRGDEGSLTDACNSGLYQYVNIAFLSTFGGGRIPKLNLGGHCNTDFGTCTGLSAEIRTCQALGIKVLLSLGGATTDTYSLSSPDDAAQVAAYLWDNYLGGSSATRPLGDAVLDGIDFDIEKGTNQPWDELAKALSQRKVILSAAPQCPIPDANLGPAIETGLFDYVWVQFYNNPQCDYSGGLDGVLDSWNKWVAAVPRGQVFIGVPATADAATSGHIPPEVMKSQVLPAIKNAGNYGGVMVWNKFYDTGFSAAISPNL
ncbi:acidic endochitinase-like [Salvia splendens]|uniref:acidic endochitinase-like n=1 Tax=Salvia splendens TaxID=180675 RepID=UPI001C252C65|nr:acidic endochitinase-like [Salvia splendens]